ncbi:unnamed protein product, partial [marine sediment metagenome]
LEDCETVYTLKSERHYNSGERRILKDKWDNCVKELLENDEYKALVEEYINCKYFLANYDYNYKQSDNFMVQHWVMNEASDCHNKLEK